MGRKWTILIRNRNLIQLIRIYIVCIEITNKFHPDSIRIHPWADRGIGACLITDSTQFIINNMYVELKQHKTYAWRAGKKSLQWYIIVVFKMPPTTQTHKNNCAHISSPQRKSLYFFCSPHLLSPLICHFYSRAVELKSRPSISCDAVGCWYWEEPSSISIMQIRNYISSPELIILRRGLIPGRLRNTFSNKSRHPRETAQTHHPHPQLRILCNSEKRFY